MRKLCGVDPIFIGCMPRSGSSLLRVILDSHPLLAADAEIGWVYGKKPLQRLRDSCRRVVGPNQRYVNKEPHIVSPQGLRRLSCLKYDRIPLIIIKREARDVLVSYLKTKDLPAFNGMNMQGIFINNAAAFIRGYRTIKKGEVDNKIDVLEIDYESLVATPKPVIAEVCDFIDVPVHPNMFKHTKFEHKKREHYSDHQASRPIFKSSVGQHKAFFKQTAIAARLAKICNRLNGLLGYSDEQKCTDNSL